MGTSADRKRAEEQRVVDLMVRIYCRGKGHARANPRERLCPECAELAAYARRRNDACPLLEERSFCQFCAVHCYSPTMRARITEVMRYSGPRMIFHRPLLALKHLLALRRHRQKGRDTR
jgi:hypothetical protein